jgi:hypothetical protein
MRSVTAVDLVARLMMMLIAINDWVSVEGQVIASCCSELVIKTCS